MQIIRVTIKPTGELTCEGEGFQGTGCLEKARQLLESLGSREPPDLKPEAFQEQQQELTQEQ